MKQKRDRSFDVFRGIGIITMILGHIGFGDLFDKYIHAFHMPMFFFISGFFFKQESLHSLIKKKAKSLLLPYITIGGTYLLVSGILDISSFSYYLYHFLFENTKGLPIAGALWFLTALFLSELLYWFIYRIQNPMLRNLMVLMISLFGMYETKLFPSRLPWSLGPACASLIFFHFGHVAADNRKCTAIIRVFNMNNLCLIVLFFVSLSLVFINGNVNMRTAEYSFIPLTVFNAMCCIVIGINISRKLVLSALNTEIMEEIGRNSIIFLCLNQLTILIEKKLVSYIIPAENVLFKVIVFVIVIIILIVAERFICSTRIKNLFGIK